MNILVDTHSFLWFIAGSSQLSSRARSLIEDPANQPFLSVASLWEMAIKVSLGRLSIGPPFEAFITQQLELNGVELLPIQARHVAVVATLPFHHRDPFDRLLIAQAQVEQMPLLGVDSAFDAYAITRLW
jgi:PIN domain nuclease of toxin-antitoxin system